MCLAGTYRDGTECVACGFGYYKVGKGDEQTLCVECPGGTAGVEVSSESESSVLLSQCREYKKSTV